MEKYEGREQKECQIMLKEVGNAIADAGGISDNQRSLEVIVAKDDIKKDDIDGRICNVLLLNMGTLPRAPIRNKYQYKDEETGSCYEVFGYGQLEPVPKLLKKRLEEKNEKLDLILITASKETQKEINIKIKESGDSLENNSKYVEKQGTAVDFFKEQISSEDPHVRFRTFECNADDLVKPLEEVVGFIRKIKKSNPDFKLYLDIHGGLRQVQISIDAIVNLLAIEDIHIEDAFSIAGIQNEQEVIEIRNVKKDIQIFDFVSGINEFINYGKSKSLEDFFKEDNAIVNNIKSISRAIQTCDIDRFESALDEMNDTLEEAVNNVKDTEQSLLNIFIENMKKDYGELLGANRTALHLLEWCISKELYQAALTVIESKMPEFLEDKVYKFEVVKKNNDTKEESMEDILKKVKEVKWKDDCNYLLERWYCNWKNVTQKDNKQKGHIRLDKKNAQGFWDAAKTESGGNNRNKKHTFHVTHEEKNRKYRKTYTFHLRFLKNIKGEDERKFETFMQLHMALKNQRNFVNHAVSGEETREEPENIINAIGAYTEMVKYFVNL